MLAFNQGLVAIILYLRSNLSGIQMFVKDSVISVLDRFLMILFCSVLLWGNVTDRPFEIEYHNLVCCFILGLAEIGFCENKVQSFIFFCDYKAKCALCIIDFINDFLLQK